MVVASVQEVMCVISCPVCGCDADAWLAAEASQQVGCLLIGKGRDWMLS